MARTHPEQNTLLEDIAPVLETIQPQKPILRRCWYCKGNLQPTAESAYGSRLWECPNCNSKMLWPETAGTLDVYGDPVFLYDENGNITHRWHWGRMEWRERCAF